MYHYHKSPECLEPFKNASIGVAHGAQPFTHGRLMGWALDGFGIYTYQANNLQKLKSDFLPLRLDELNTCYFVFLGYWWQFSCRWRMWRTLWTSRYWRGRLPLPQVNFRQIWQMFSIKTSVFPAVPSFRTTLPARDQLWETVPARREGPTFATQAVEHRYITYNMGLGWDLCCKVCVQPGTEEEELMIYLAKWDAQWIYQYTVNDYLK